MTPKARLPKSKQQPRFHLGRIAVLVVTVENPPAAGPDHAVWSLPPDRHVPRPIRIVPEEARLHPVDRIVSPAFHDGARAQVRPALPVRQIASGEVELDLPGPDDDPPPSRSAAEMTGAGSPARNSSASRMSHQSSAHAHGESGYRPALAAHRRKAEAVCPNARSGGCRRASSLHHFPGASVLPLSST